MPAFTQAPSKDELVRHLNANIEPLHAWRSTEVKIGTRGVMGLLKLEASLAVERPNHFRLRAGLGTIKSVADLGSNDERFWFWFSNHPQRRIITARHEQLAHAQRVLQIPFEPEWLLEALGVVPLDAEHFALYSGRDSGDPLSLVSRRETPDGAVMHRVIQVDPRQRLIVGHQLYAVDRDGSNRFRLIAGATLSDHQRDPATGIVLPHRVELAWPQADLAMTMTIGRVEVNPSRIPVATWELPKINGHPPLELAAPDVPRDGYGRPAQPLHAGSGREVFTAEDWRSGDAP